MEVKLSDIHRFIEVRTYDFNEGQKKFIAWFSARLMAADLNIEEAKGEELKILLKAQSTAEIFCNKVKNMIQEMNNGNCNFDSLMRMFCRICDKGVKIIPDQSKRSETEGEIFYAIGISTHLSKR